MHSRLRQGIPASWRERTLLLPVAERFAKGLGEPTAAPARSPPRPPPYFRSPIIRRLTGHDLAVA